MNAKAKHLFDAGRESLVNAQACLSLGQYSEAEKAASVAVFQTSQAFLLKNSGPFDDGDDGDAFSDCRSKTECVEIDQVISLSEAYRSREKNDADGTSPSQGSPETSVAAVEKAIRFIDYIAKHIE